MNLADHWEHRTINLERRDTGILPNYGVIEEIRVRPGSPVLNMDASRPCRFVFALYDGDGRMVDCTAILFSRGVR